MKTEKVRVNYNENLLNGIKIIRTPTDLMLHYELKLNITKYKLVKENITHEAVDHFNLSHRLTALLPE